MYKNVSIDYCMEADEVWVVKQYIGYKLVYVFTWRIMGEASITQVIPLDYANKDYFVEEVSAFMATMSHWIPIPEPPDMISNNTIKAWRNPNGKAHPY